eukprot:2119635-Pleurochrysis_carterae.AAC.10
MLAPGALRAAAPWASRPCRPTSSTRRCACAASRPSASAPQDQASRGGHESLRMKMTSGMKGR